MLVTLKSILKKAQEGAYGVGAFNTTDLEITQAIISAAEELSSPVIIQTTPKAIEYAGLGELACLIKTLAQETKIPVALHLDHSKSYLLAQRCARVGYTSLMIDGSMLTLAKNIAITKKVARLARVYKISVEAEVGVLRGEEDFLKSKRLLMTDAEEANVFVKKTNIDALAVSIGNAHGLALPQEKLDFTRLKEIRKKVKVPLVLHGASQGISSKDIKKAIKMGICKVNIDTDLRLAFVRGLRQILTKKTLYDPRQILGRAREEVKKEVQKKIKLFGSQGKASRKVTASNF